VRLIGLRPRLLTFPIDLNTIGDHIRKRRLDLNLLQRDAAERIGVTTSCVWNWENDASSPDWRHWKSIIEFLGYDPVPRAVALPAQLILSRQRMNLSQKEMARRIGIDPTTLARWEQGKRTPSGVYLSMLEKAGVRFRQE